MSETNVLLSTFFFAHLTFTIKHTLSKCVNMSIAGQSNRKLSPTTNLLNSLVAELLHFLKMKTTKSSPTYSYSSTEGV